jgi:hypothetical protein
LTALGHLVLFLSIAALLSKGEQRLITEVVVLGGMS